MMTKPGWLGRVTAAAARQLRALIPPLTPGVIFRAILGVLLFFCGVLLAIWLIIRYRRHIPED
jgi:hypothetical protein